MPLLKLETSARLPDARKASLAAALSAVLARTTGKPEAVCMVSVTEAAIMTMAGRPVPAAYADVRGIGGFNRDVNGRLTRELCALLKQELQIEPGHVYVTFTDVPATHWGWNESTFG